MNLSEYSLRRSQGEYLPRFTEPEVNNCLSIILRVEYQELQNQELKHGNNNHKCLLAYVLTSKIH